MFTQGFPTATSRQSTGSTKCWHPEFPFPLQHSPFVLVVYNPSCYAYSQPSAYNTLSKTRLLHTLNRSVELSTMASVSPVTGEQRCSVSLSIEAQVSGWLAALRCICYRSCAQPQIYISLRGMLSYTVLKRIWLSLHRQAQVVEPSPSTCYSRRL